MALVRSIATVGGYTAISRVLGFVRDILIAAVLGASPIADAFFVAFRFPNFFRRIFGEGAFNAAFVPLFARRLEGDGGGDANGDGSARRFAEDALAAMLLVLLPLSALIMAAMPWLMYVIAPGFAAEPAKFDLTVDLTRITFPYLLFMALVALLGGVLNSLYRFAAMAAAPILLNVFFIVALAGIAPFVDRPGHLLAWTVAAAGAGQFLLLAIAAARAGMPLALPRPRLNAGMKRLFKLMIPGVLSAGALQINLVVGTIVASMQAGAVSYLYYADRVYQLPLGLIGIAFGIVLLPDLSRKLRAGDEAAASNSLNRGLELAMLLTLPATAALAVIPWEIVVVLFERGAFGDEASQATAAALAAFATGLPAFVLVKILQPAFYAREDTVTPLKTAVASVVANIVLSLALFFPLRHVGIALATSIAAWLHVALLAWLLRRRGFLEIDARCRSRLPRILLAAALMGGVVWLGARPLSHWFAAALPLQVTALAILVGGGMLTFALVAVAVRAADWRELRQQFRRRAAVDPASPPPQG